jgi:hypothetical protein
MYEWLVTEDLLVTFLGDDGAYGTMETRPRLLIRDSGCRYATVLSFGDDERIHLNGEFVDLGDDFTQVLGLLDDLSERTSGDLSMLDDETFSEAYAE